MDKLTPQDVRQQARKAVGERKTMADNKGKMYMEVPTALVEQGKTAKRADGSEYTYNVLRFPKGAVDAEGRNLAGAIAYPNFVNEIEGTTERCTVVFYTDRELQVRVPRRDEAGEIMSDEKGAWLLDTVTMRAGAVRKAISAAIDQPAQQRQPRRWVYVDVPRSMVKTNLTATRGDGSEFTYNALDLGKDVVTASGVDLSGGTAYPTYINELSDLSAETHDPAKWCTAVFAGDRDLSVRVPVRGEDGKVVTLDDGKWERESVKVSAGDLKGAIEGARARFATQAVEQRRAPGITH